MYLNCLVAFLFGRCEIQLCLFNISIMISRVLLKTWTWATAMKLLRHDWRNTIQMNLILSMFPLFRNDAKLFFFQKQTNRNDLDFAATRMGFTYHQRNLNFLFSPPPTKSEANYSSPKKVVLLRRFILIIDSPRNTATAHTKARWIVYIYLATSCITVTNIARHISISRRTIPANLTHARSRRHRLMKKVVLLWRFILIIVVTIGFACRTIGSTVWAAATRPSPPVAVIIGRVGAVAPANIAVVGAIASRLIVRGAVSLVLWATLGVSVPERK